METTLHRQLKRLYASGEEANEVSVDGYRIDAVADDRLIEVQCASLGAIRDKIRALCRNNDVTVVKPIVARRRIVRHETRDGPELSRRLSPKRESLLHAFEDLVYFTAAFPHDRLRVEVIEIEVNEHRIPRRSRRRQRDHRVTDRELVEVLSQTRFESPHDFADLLPVVTEPFTTLEIAESSGVPRWLAQKAAYFLRETGAWATVGKRGNAWLYARTALAKRVA